MYYSRVLFAKVKRNGYKFFGVLIPSIRVTAEKEANASNFERTRLNILARWRVFGGTSVALDHEQVVAAVVVAGVDRRRGGGAQLAVVDDRDASESHAHQSISTVKRKINQERRLLGYLLLDDEGGGRRRLEMESSPSGRDQHLFI